MPDAAACALYDSADHLFRWKYDGKMAEGEGFEPYSLVACPQFPDTSEVK
jgi:hypothetical protein